MILEAITFTVPTEEMRQAMANAAVGDDVFGEDPTVNELQDYTARLLGKEAGLYVASGVMGNQIALAVHTEAGDEVIIEEEAHIFYYEAASPSIISRVQLRTLPSDNGVIPLEKIEAAIRPDDLHFPKTRLICLENTHNRHGGTILPLDYLKEVRKLADKHGLGLHCDGARMWNACAAANISPEEFASPFDTLSVCLSKGLGAPVGSVIVGSREQIDKARKWRKRLGGGMRQAGIIAAGGLYALKNNFTLLQGTHETAKDFAEIVNESKNIDISRDEVHSNIVIFRIDKKIDAAELESKLRDRGVLVIPFGPDKIRAVFHFQTNREDALRAAEIIRDTACEW